MNDILNILDPRFYEIADGQVAIAYYDEFAKGKLVIPDEIEGLPVTSIKDSAFFDCGSLRSIIIPEGVTSIGDYAFSGCCSLTSIIIPQGVTIIGDHAFYDCGSLTSITIPNSVTRIGDFAFEHCTSLTSITMPEKFKPESERRRLGLSCWAKIND